MSGSGLLVLLPLVGAILGAVVGGFVGAWANSWYRDRQAKKAQDQERKGLLFLVHAEVYFNELAASAFSSPGPAVLYRHLRTDVWDKSHVRLAQLLPADDTRRLVSYYSLIQVLPNLELAQELAQEEESSEYDSDKETKEIIKLLKTTRNDVMNLIRSYGVEAPDFPDLEDEGLEEDSAK